MVRPFLGNKIGKSCWEKNVKEKEKNKSKLPIFNFHSKSLLYTDN